VVSATSEPEPGSRPVATDVQQAECASAERTLKEALVAAANGCASNDDCDLFGTCHAVLARTTAALWKLKGQAQDACRVVRDTEVVMSCASRARCLDHRCVRK
jgi:hypothetical protein